MQSWRCTQNNEIHWQNFDLHCVCEFNQFVHMYTFEYDTPCVKYLVRNLCLIMLLLWRFLLFVLLNTRKSVIIPNVNAYFLGISSSCHLYTQIQTQERILEYNTNCGSNSDTKIRNGIIILCCWMFTKGEKWAHNRRMQSFMHLES